MPPSVGPVWPADRDLPGVRRTIHFAAFAALASAAVQGAEPLPEPLTLAAALALADDHPAFVHSQATLDSRKADRAAAVAQTGVRAGIHARARLIEPNSHARNQSHDDHALRLRVTKPLLDFGRSQAAVLAADNEVEGEKWAVLAARQERRLAITEAFFNVILADLTFARDDEAMAIAFVRMDRARERNELGQASDIRLRELESIYQDSRRGRFASEARQRLSRAKLATAMNRPGELSEQLIPPALPGVRRPRPELDVLEKAMLEKNPRLRALRLRLRAAQDRVKQARAGDRPLVNGEVEAAAHTRKTNSTDVWRAGVTLEVPLSTGGRTAARLARRQADVSRQQAELSQARLDLSNQVLEAWLALETLTVSQDSSLAFMDYRDLYLDRSRALYEQEVRADLGDAMVQISAARLRQVQTEFRLAMTWAELDAMTGSTPEELERQLVGGER